LRPAHRGHGAEAFGGEQHFVAHPRIHRVERHHGIAAIRPVQVERLHQQNLAPFVAGVFHSGHDLADDARNQHPRLPFFASFTGAGAVFAVESVLAARFTWTESTIPTIVVSVGTSMGRKGKLDSFPLHQ